MQSQPEIIPSLPEHSTKRSKPQDYATRKISDKWDGPPHRSPRQHIHQHRCSSPHTTNDSTATTIRV